MPEAVDLSTGSAETLALYGVEPDEPSFRRHCLYARRLIERGVRFVQLFDADWDHHERICRRLPLKCAVVDQASTALIIDLERRGLLDETLVVNATEFGRTPISQSVSTEGGITTELGCDHHPDAFSVWLAGGGIQRGRVYGSTDDFAHSVAEDPVHVDDLNATLLHLMGIDRERLTFFHQGRDFRLTDVAGRVVPEILV